MCGIIGFYNKHSDASEYKKNLLNAVDSLKMRGPDSNGTFFDKNTGLGHTRLAVIDTSNAGNQPFTDSSGKYTLIFNGEFYNHKGYRNELENDGVKFISESDTEVLLYLLVKYGKDAIQKINGCFAFAFYDSVKNEIIIARDRMGINPLLYYVEDDKIVFASEMKALIAFGLKPDIDYEAVFSYFQLNYFPPNQCVFRNTFKLKPGTYAVINENGIKNHEYYTIPLSINNTEFPDYIQAKKQLYTLLDESVKRRLISDVPIGCFLSGGIDSSIITALASAHTNNLNTFSIGFTDESYFDETNYANIVAEKYKTNHTVFKISSNDILDNFFKIIDYFDEPFADSSALAVYILSYCTKQKATVALSGDGADEMFAGYNKHSAHFNASYMGVKENFVKAFNPLWKIMPKSRSNKSSNLFRQLYRFSEGCKFTPRDRYWFWASIGSENYVESLLKRTINKLEFENKKNEYLKSVSNLSDINSVLYADMHLVLQGDMLTKVDLMSMANSLEVRTPFLDHNVVDFVFSLPYSYKITNSSRKRILKDTFRHLLPEELLNRPKHGFEVPLLKWFRNELWNLIDNDYLSEDYIKEQNIFNYNVIKKLKKQIHSENPEDSHAKIWALLVFQNWWKKYIMK